MKTPEESAQEYIPNELTREYLEKIVHELMLYLEKDNKDLILNALAEALGSGNIEQALEHLNQALKEKYENT